MRFSCQLGTFVLLNIMKIDKKLRKNGLMKCFNIQKIWFNLKQFREVCWKSKKINCGESVLILNQCYLVTKVPI